jgi:hypothetical protein
MKTVTWTVTVIAVFLAATFIWFKRAKKDMLGAITIAVGIILAAAAFLVISGCAVAPERAPWLEAGFAHDRQGTVGGNPACIVRFRQPIGPPGKEDWLLVSAVHHSSCPDQDDRGEINQLEVTAKIPLGRRK